MANEAVDTGKGTISNEIMYEFLTGDKPATDVKEKETEKVVSSEPKEKEVQEETKAKVDTSEVAPKPAAPVSEATDGEQPKAKDKFGGDYRKLKESYDESVKWNTKLSQDVAEIKRKFEAAESERRSPQQEKRQITQDELLDWQNKDPVGFNRWVAKQEADASIKPVREDMLTIKKVVDGFVASQVVNKYRAKYEDFREQELDIKEVVDSLPEELTANPQFYDMVLENAYWAAKGKKHVADSASAEQKKREVVAERTQRKEEAHVEGSKSKTTQEEPFDLKTASSKEIFSYLKSRGFAR